MDELVSVIVPVYNAAEYLPRTVAAVRAQTYSRWELLLVDDCSTDDGAELIRKLASGWGDDRIRLLRTEKNGGAANARNLGLKAAAGRYIAFLDADDVWMPDKLDRELEFMKQKDAAFVFTAYEFGDEQAEGTGKIVHVPERLGYRQALSRTVIFTTTVLFDTDKLDKALLAMPEVKSEDTAAWWKILRSGVTAYGLDEVLAVYRRPKHSLSSNKLEAVRRIWALYRGQEGLGLADSVFQLVRWAFRAAWRRL